MIEVDRETERRNAWRQYGVGVLVAGVLLWFVTDDKVLYCVILAVGALVLGYRHWTVERFSPTLAQHYGHQVVIGAADAMLAVFARDAWLRDSWSRDGAPLDRLLRLDSRALSAAVAALHADGFPVRRLHGPFQVVNRMVAAVLGFVPGVVLGYVLTRVGVTWSGWTVWPVVVAAVLAVTGRLVISVYNNGRLAWIADSMRTNTRNELVALLDPPWRGRKEAVVEELRRLAAHAVGTAPGRQPPELRVLTRLTVSGLVAGGLAGIVLLGG
jgi:hypothetical protein